MPDQEGSWVGNEDAKSNLPALVISGENVSEVIIIFEFIQPK
ncbi:hypothetical protein GA0116948_10432 [Chitinophaga costaii]|uniref:Uncharacterized protein n=1 Tax=Chitinophaga costaii TaxID=1335309 RepID=A0A1C4CAA3_9BACT|nr:hypothetical protein GA0116948_10432 [Chitinophaga costaii]